MRREFLEVVGGFTSRESLRKRRTVREVGPMSERSGDSDTKLGPAVVSKNPWLSGEGEPEENVVIGREGAAAALINLAKAVSSARYGDYFPDLVEHLTRALEADYCFVGAYDAGRVSTLAVFGEDRMLENFSYDLAGTPCEHVLSPEVCLFGSAVQERFPLDTLLVAMGIEAYVGAPLCDSDGKALGLLAVLYKQPILDGALPMLVMEVAAIQSAYELEALERGRERDRLQAQLRQSQKMDAIGQLAGGIAHDFNNLLQLMLGHLDLALEDIPADAKAHDDLVVVAEACESGVALVRRLLSFSQNQALAMGPVDLNQVTSNSVRLLRRIIGENIEVGFAPDPRANACLIYADYVQLEQVLMNLCVNAKHAMPRGGVLELSTRVVTFSEQDLRLRPWTKPGEFLLLKVKDNGVGIDPTHLERVFEPFFSTKPEGEGTGLGLAIVYGIVTQHKGFVELVSEPGRGTTVTCALPVMRGVEVPVAYDEPEHEPSAQPRTILIAEDDPMVRSLAKRILERGGYSVLLARDGEEASKVFAEHQDEIDLCLLDVVMPHRNGVEVFKEIRARYPRLPVIMSSGYSDGALDDIEATDVDLVLPKPYGPRTLLAKVKAAMRAVQPLAVY